MSKWVPLSHISGISSDREKGAYLEKDDLGKVTLAGQSPCGGVPITLKNIKSVKVSFPVWNKWLTKVHIYTCQVSRLRCDCHAET